MLNDLIGEYYEGKISSQKLIEYISRNNLSAETVYLDYFNLTETPICSVCSKVKTYTGFKRGYYCCESHNTKEEINLKTDDELISEIFELSNKTDYKSNSFGLKFKKYEKRLSYKFQNKKGKELKYCIFNKINFTPTCSVENCGKNAIFGGYDKGYTYGCCMSHSIKASPIASVWTKESRDLVSKTIKNQRSNWTHEERKEFGNLTSSGIQLSLENNPNLFSEALEHRIETTVQKYGVENISQSEDIKKLKEETSLSNHGVTTYFKILSKDKGVLKRVKETNICSGRWICDSKRTDFNLYSELCRKHTRKQNLNELENFQLRGAVERGGYHLDHIFSIAEGFKNNVAPWIIGSLINLRMIPALQNISKNSKSDMSIEDLLYKYSQTETSLNF